MSQSSQCKAARSAVVAIIGAGLACNPSTANGLEGQDTAAGDLLAQVNLFQQELEAVRFEMGKPIWNGHGLGVTNATPREVYHQVLTLLEKTDRLYFELTHRRPTGSPLMLGNVTSQDLGQVIDSALARIRAINRHLNIQTPKAGLGAVQTAGLSDVFRAVTRANHQLTLLLTEPFTPADVFQQVTQALGFATRLRGIFPGQRVPQEPTFEPGKRPADVYRRLLACLELIRDIATLSGLETIQLTLDGVDIDHVDPNDVYDLATIVVAELAHIHAHASGVKPPRKSYPPSHKFPSHVFQRAGILEVQLGQIRRLVEKNPSWLAE